MNAGGQDFMAFMAVFWVFFAIAMLISMVIWVFTIFCWWRIMSKAGYNGLWALLMLVPAGNLVLVIWMAFGNWPVLSEISGLRSGALRPPSPVSPPPRML